MQTSSLHARRPSAANLAFSPPDTHPTANARQRAPLSPRDGLRENPTSDIALTPKGERYAAEHIKGDASPNVTRAKIERAIDRHLTLVTVLLAWLDDADGDPDQEPELAFTVCEANLGAYSQLQVEEDAGDMPEIVNEDGGDILDEPHDSNISEDMEYDPGDFPFYPNGSHISGGGSGI